MSDTYLARLAAAALQRACLRGEAEVTLKGGIRLYWQVAGDTTRLTIGRKRAQVSSTELVVFRRDCAIPADARRHPEVGQARREINGSIWNVICFEWNRES